MIVMIVGIVTIIAVAAGIAVIGVVIAIGTAVADGIAAADIGMVRVIVARDLSHVPAAVTAHTANKSPPRRIKAPQILRRFVYHRSEQVCLCRTRLPTHAR